MRALYIIYLCTNIYICTHTHIHTYTQKHTCMHTYIYKYIYICTTPRRWASFCVDTLPFHFCQPQHPQIVIVVELIATRTGGKLRDSQQGADDSVRLFITVNVSLPPTPVLNSLDLENSPPKTHISPPLRPSMHA